MDDRTDRKLLELAAKAAGYQYRPQNQVIVVGGIPSNWNPLTDDGDALRLAVKVGIRISYDFQNDLTECVYDIDGDFYDLTEPWSEDKFAATRRAVVRAAAEIGAKEGE